MLITLKDTSRFENKNVYFPGWMVVCYSFENRCQINYVLSPMVLYAQVRLVPVHGPNGRLVRFAARTWRYMGNRYPCCFDVRFFGTVVSAEKTKVCVVTPGARTVLSFFRQLSFFFFIVKRTVNVFNESCSKIPISGDRPTSRATTLTLTKVCFYLPMDYALIWTIDMGEPMPCPTVRVDNDRGPCG